MSWKNVKETYRIGHIVHMREGAVLIGSPYIPDLLHVDPDGTVTHGKLGPPKNDDLARYIEEMTANPERLRQLIAAPDTFSKSLPVFTYEGVEIIEKQCEEYGWPNVTHDGELMYDNTFSKDRKRVVKWAIENAEAGVELAADRITEIRTKLAETQLLHAKYSDQLERLKRENP